MRNGVNWLCWMLGVELSCTGSEAGEIITDNALLDSLEYSQISQESRNGGIKRAQSWQG